MSATCPNCGRELAADGAVQVHGRLRNSEYGLRLDGEFECAGCGEPLIYEEAGEGGLGTLSSRRRFEGGEYSA